MRHFESVVGRVDADTNCDEVVTFVVSYPGYLAIDNDTDNYNYTT